MANKTVKKETSKFDFSDSINAIKNTAKTVNAQVKEVAGEVAEDLKENGAQLREMAVTPVKEAYNKAYNRVTDTVNVENITKAAKDANAYTLKTAEELVDGVLVSSEKWHGIVEKAVKGSLKLASKQQDTMFDTLETVKGQFSKSANRFKKLVSNK